MLASKHDDADAADDGREELTDGGNKSSSCGFGLVYRMGSFGVPLENIQLSESQDNAGICSPDVKAFESGCCAKSRHHGRSDVDGVSFKAREGGLWRSTVDAACCSLILRPIQRSR